jgi:hypothetical protein
MRRALPPLHHTSSLRRDFGQAQFYLYLKHVKDKSFVIGYTNAGPTRVVAYSKLWDEFFEFLRQQVVNVCCGHEHDSSEWSHQADCT